MNVHKIIHGGYLSKQKTFIISGVGILSAIASYLVGDTDLFLTLESVFAIGGIYFLRKANKTKRKDNAKSARKISKSRRNS